MNGHLGDIPVYPILKHSHPNYHIFQLIISYPIKHPNNPNISKRRRSVPAARDQIALTDSAQRPAIFVVDFGDWWVQRFNPKTFTSKICQCWFNMVQYVTTHIKICPIIVLFISIYQAKFMKQKVNHLSTHSANTCPKLLDALDFGLFLTVHMFKEKHVSITCICSFGAIKFKKKPDTISIESPKIHRQTSIYWGIYMPRCPK